MADTASVAYKKSCQVALDVARLWNMPPMVRGYLETGNLENRMEARYMAYCGMLEGGLAACIAAEVAFEVAEWNGVDAAGLLKHVLSLATKAVEAEKYG